MKTLITVSVLAAASVLGISAVAAQPAGSNMPGAGGTSQSGPSGGGMMPGMMGQAGPSGGPMGMGMMGAGMMGRGMMRPGMTRMMVVMMDANGDGTVSLDEFQAVHARMFKAMDANGDGKLTADEVSAFHGGAGSSGSK
ncbi:hypothetical protein CCR97_12805 [Rhodoplanes elegans]|uniref:EF-hand domain-containing protein n=1 Tax=Rhodoplanes elegans TaxID=29408 RepID=A0A327KDI6_9BRAD|nr:EF-hand domain-containing protein [Rhodoplanes elegans]MBK5959082.1 hypothetical protein [Rhodoplanes elegans]RAI36820.1 hypothetical protein CH338_17070 [Rhodoplanes elegans]